MEKEALSSLSQNNFILGQRVGIDESSSSSFGIGTIRFIGPLQDASDSEIWLGIEWDDPKRGKHNGNVNGVKYFECGEGCGSLVKPEKIAKGVSFMDAVNERYIDNTITLAEEDSYLMNSDGKRSKKIELVGMDKVGAMQSKIDVLRDVILKRSWIKSSSPDIGVQMPNIVHLDVSQNLIDSWDTVTDITRQLPLLEVLNVSHSRLADPSSPDKLKGAFPKLRSLVLNSCAISSWSKITFVDNHMPWLERSSCVTMESLYLQKTVISSLDFRVYNLLTWKETTSQNGKKL